jgi:hypothetical protein
MPHDLCTVSRRQMHLLPNNRPWVSLWATSYLVPVANPQATSPMEDLPLWSQLLPSNSKIKMSLVDTAYVPETS